MNLKCLHLETQFDLWPSEMTTEVMTSTSHVIFSKDTESYLQYKFKRCFKDGAVGEMLRVIFYDSENHNKYQILKGVDFTD